MNVQSQKRFLQSITACLLFALNLTQANAQAIGTGFTGLPAQPTSYSVPELKSFASDTTSACMSPQAIADPFLDLFGKTKDLVSGIAKSKSENAKLEKQFGCFKEIEGCPVNAADVATKNNQCIAKYEIRIQSLNGDAGQIDCLQDQFSKIQAQIEQMKNTSIDPFIDSATKAVTEMNNEIEDRKAQMEAVGEKLNGGKDGSKGYRQIQGELKSLSANLRDFKLSQRAGIEKFIAGKANYEKRIKQYTMSKAYDCFNSQSLDSTDICERGGVAVSPKELLICRYEQAVRSKYSKDDPAGKAAAAKQREALQKKLAELDKNIAAGVTIPATAQEAVGPVSSKNVNTLEEFDRFVSTNFGGYNQGKINSAQVMKFKMRQCYAQAESEVAKARTDKGSDLYNLQEDYKNAEKNNEDSVNKQISTVSQTFSENMKLTLPTNACSSAPIGDKLSCVDALTNIVDSALTGTTSVSSNTKLSGPALALTNGQAPMFTGKDTISGSDPKGARNITVTCTGVNGCVDTYERLNKALVAVKAKAEANKKTFQNNVNIQVMKLVKANQQMFQQASGKLRDNLSRLGKYFGDVKDMTIDKDIKPDEATGIYSTDQLTALLYNGLKPPMPTLDLATISGAKAKIEEKKGEASKEIEAFKKGIEDARTKELACAKDDKVDARAERKEVNDCIKEECAPEKVKDLKNDWEKIVKWTGGVDECTDDKLEKYKSKLTAGVEPTIENLTSICKKTYKEKNSKKVTEKIKGVCQNTIDSCKEQFDGMKPELLESISKKAFNSISGSDKFGD